MLDDILAVSHDLIAITVAVSKRSDSNEGLLSDYHDLTKRWISASPFIENRPEYSASSSPLRGYTDSPLTPPAFASFGGEPISSSLLGDAANRARKDLSRYLGKPSAKKRPRFALAPCTMHSVGVVYMILQHYMHARGAFGVWQNERIRHWYVGTRKTIERIDEVLDLVGIRQRQALRDGDIRLAEVLQAQNSEYCRRLAQIYSIRELRAPVLYTVFQGQNVVGDREALRDTAIGVNGIDTTISSYFGRADPHDQPNRDVESVDFVLLQSRHFDGEEITVIGKLHRSKNRLLSTVNRALFIDFDPARDVRSSYIPYYRPKPQDRGVRVTGIYDHAASLLRDAVVERHFHYYESLIGLPGRFPATAPRPLNPSMRWRRTSAALDRYAEAEAAGKSVSASLANQKDLAREMYRLTSVGQKNPVYRASSIDKELIADRERRIEGYSRVFSLTRRKKSRSGRSSTVAALEKLFQLVNRYLAAFTRHTYFNLRDDDPNYIESDWSTDLVDQRFLDCGVYAVTQAYEISRVLHAASPYSIRYRYVTFLNHVCVVGYIANTYASMINNDRVVGPVSLGNKGTGSTRRFNASLQLAKRAFSTVFEVHYAIFAVVVSPSSVNARQSDKRASSALWLLYKRSIAWSVRNEVAISYYQGIQRFDELSGVLQRRLTNSGAGAPSRDSADRIAEDALRLYRLAELLAHRCNFALLPDADDKFMRLYVAALVPVAGSRHPIEKTMPMYAAHRIVRPFRSLSSANTLLDKKVGDDHLNELAGLAKGTKKCSEAEIAAHAAEWRKLMAEIRKADEEESNDE